MKNPLMAAGYVLLGLGMLKEALGKPASGSVGDLGRSPFPRTLGDVGRPLLGEDERARKALQLGLTDLSRGEVRAVRDIDERVAYIKKWINKGSLSPVVRAAGVAAVSRKCQTRNGVRWCTTPKDYENEIAALFRQVQDAATPLALRYVRDHAKVDQFTSAERLVQFVRGGDCDDGTVKIGALLMAIGYPIKLRIIQSNRADSWDHIYLLVGIPPGGPTEWIALDWSVYPFRPIRWQAPGAAEVAKTGKPAGMVVRVKDYPV